MTFAVTALVWETTSEHLLLSNKFALQTGLINMVMPNVERVPLFGRPVFSTNWAQLIREQEASACALYEDDVFPKEMEEICDLSAPLAIGDQDITTLSEIAQRYARRYPSMTKAIPLHAHPDLD